MSVEKMKMIDIIGHQSILYYVTKQIVLSETMHMVNAFQEINSNNFALPASDEKNEMNRLIDLCYIRPYSGDDDFSNVTRAMKKLRDMCEVTDRFIFKEDDVIDDKTEIENQINALADKFSAVYDKLKDTEREKEDIIKSIEQLKFLKNLQIPIENLEDLSNFNMQIYKISSENALRLSDNYENLPSIITKIYEDEGYEVQIAFTPVLLKAEADRIFKSVNYEPIDIPEGYEGTPEIVNKVLNDKLAELDKKIEELSSELKKLSSDNQYQVCLLEKSLELQTKIEEVKGFTACTNDFFYMAGWVPESLYPLFKERLQDYDDNIIILEKSPEELGKDTKVPTKLSNSALFKPFEAMVNVYGTPSYNEIDPTKFLAITYMIIFGLMFGDLGQGLVFVFAGLYMVKKMGRPNLGGVLLRIGSMSSIVGIVYGSFFGNETLLPALFNNILNLNFTFIHPIESQFTMPVLIVSVVFGVSLLLIAYVFNLINSIKKKDLENGLFGRNGLTGLILYVSILLFIVVKTGYLPTIMNNIVWFIIFIVLLLVTVLKQPIANAVMHKNKLLDEKPSDYFVEAGFGALETVIGFISNTLSFIRIGAFAINHAALFMAFEILGKLIGGGSLLSVGGVIMFILGNVMIIGLEGLIVFIQGLRLQFYEFFGKYYEGEGIEFKPVKLDNFNSKLVKPQENNVIQKKLIVE